MAWWFVQIVKGKDMSDIQNANAALDVGVLVSSKKKRKLLTIKFKETKKAKQRCFSCSFKVKSKYQRSFLLLASHGEPRERRHGQKRCCLCYV